MADQRFFWITLDGGETWRQVTETEYVNLQQRTGANRRYKKPDAPDICDFISGKLGGRIVRPRGAIISYGKVLQPGK